MVACWATGGALLGVGGSPDSHPPTKGESPACKGLLSPKIIFRWTYGSARKVWKFLTLLSVLVVHEHFKSTFLVQDSGFIDLKSEQVGFHVVTN